MDATFACQPVPAAQPAPVPDRTAPAEGRTVVIDKNRMRDVLALVGPASERLLLQSLIADLRSARAALIRAINCKDALELRAQTHVLASLAGTFGAAGLDRAARDLEARSLAGAEVPEDGGVLNQANRVIADLLTRLGGLR